MQLGPDNGLQYPVHLCNRCADRGIFGRPYDPVQVYLGAHVTIGGRIWHTGVPLTKHSSMTVTKHCKSMNIGYSRDHIQVHAGSYSSKGLTKHKQEQVYMPLHKYKDTFHTFCQSCDFIVVQNSLGYMYTPSHALSFLI